VRTVGAVLFGPRRNPRNLHGHSLGDAGVAPSTPKGGRGKSSRVSGASQLCQDQSQSRAEVVGLRRPVRAKDTRGMTSTRLITAKSPHRMNVQRHGNLNNISSGIEAQPEEKLYCEVNELQ